MAKPLWGGLLIGLTTLLVGWFYAQCLDSEVVGALRDDGIYAILGKALATGQGFHLIHLPLNPPQSKYPILYPLILALGWWINPRFPENLPLLNGLTLAFSLATVPLVFYYFQLCKKASIAMAWLLALLTGSALIAYGTTLMSEGPYLFFSLLTLFYAERSLPKGGKRALWGCVLLSVLAFHTRVIGVTLILSIAGWLACQKRYQQALSYLLLSSLFTVLPWGLWTAFSQPTMDVSNYALLHPYSNYSLIFATLTQNPVQYWQTLLSSVGSFIMDLTQLFFPILINPSLVFPNFVMAQHPLLASGYFIGLLLLSYSLLGYFLVSLLKVLNKAWQSQNGALLSISALYVSLYCLLILFWNFESHLGRFLLLVSPWLWFYLLRPLDFSLNTSKRVLALKGMLLTLISGLALCLTPWTYQMLYSARKAHFLSMSPQLVELWQDYKSTFSYIQHQLPSQATVGAFYDTTVYLYTQHPTVFAFFSALRTRNGLPLPTAYTEFLDSMQRQGIRYFLVEPQMIRPQGQEFSENLFVKKLIELEPTHFTKRYTSPHGLIQLYERIAP